MQNIFDRFPDARLSYNLKTDVNWTTKQHYDDLELI